MRTSIEDRLMNLEDGLIRIQSEINDLKKRMDNAEHNIRIHINGTE